ncbi:hypothetical protein FB451DRAFT_1399806 [Mycena latifolia]|nr:hypothetical protein FB451DRAFT_1399806 [Mycena latifolia]
MCEAEEELRDTDEEGGPAELLYTEDWEREAELLERDAEEDDDTGDTSLWAEEELRALLIEDERVADAEETTLLEREADVGTELLQWAEEDERDADADDEARRLAEDDREAVPDETELLREADVLTALEVPCEELAGCEDEEEMV